MAGRIENLKPFQPGQSGNPGGRPKGDSVTAWLRKKLQDDSEKKPGKTRAESVAMAILDAAEDGDFKLIKELLDRTEGKVAESVVVESGPEQTVLDALELLRERQRKRTGGTP